MATAAFEGTNFALQDTPVVGTLVHSRTGGAKVYCTSDEVFSTSTAGAGSTFECAKLPKGAVVLFSLVTPIDSDTFGAPDAHAAAATGKLGITGDTDLFGDITDTNTSALAQLIAPVPDGTTYTTTLENKLQAAVDVFITTADNNVVSTEGYSVKIFYTLG